MMISSSLIQTEAGQALLEFELVRTHADRPYGIRAVLKQDGKTVDAAEARERFFTQAEAEAAIQMLTRYQVTPCTLCDIV